MSSKTKSFISDQAKEFRKSFQVNNSTSPASRTGQRTLIVEEFKEFLEAEQQLLIDFKRNSEECLKELADLVYVCYQYAANVGWDLDEALNRVHRSNMTKLGEDGQPIRREDGKVLKGPNYQPPVLTDLV
jgi:NTP pyrophosphatase (non-canonical NTP hydrolase)